MSLASLREHMLFANELLLVNFLINCDKVFGLIL